MAEPSAKQRKRDAIGSLKGLASELGFTHVHSQASDLSRDDFMKFQNDVMEKSATPAKTPDPGPKAQGLDLRPQAQDSKPKNQDSRPKTLDLRSKTQDPRPRA